jgi:regulator of sigma E protease
MTGFIVFLLVLSLLVFVHELGHFLAAKAFNIYCDRFSIGMPPRIFGFKWGETDYCVGALLFGGYVKMAGQEDSPLSEEEREQTYGHVPPDRWFNNKPVWQRIIVLLAGPLMNLALAFAIYLFIAGNGAMVPVAELEARVGIIEEESPARSAPLWRLEAGQTATDTNREPDASGWQTGDLLLTQNGQRVKNIGEVAVNSILKGPGFEHEFLIERTTPDGATERYLSRVVPKQLGEEDEYHRIGVAPFDGALVQEVLADTPAAAAGLHKDDIILRANGQPVDRSTFVKLIEAIPEGDTVTLAVQRGGEVIEKSLTPLTLGRFNEMYLAPAYNPTSGENAEAQPVVDFVMPNFSKSSGLMRKDRILSIEGQPATAKLLYELEKSRPGGSIAMEVERPAVLFGILRKGSTFSVDVPVTSVRAIGVALGSPMVYHQAAPSQIVPEAWAELKQQVGVVMGTLGALFSRTVSPKDLGGPVMIAQITMQAAELGWERLFRTTAFISLNLFILNLLPLPVLDGGQIVMNLIEGVRRKPLSIAFQERLQQAGVLLLIGLMLFVTWNDINRLFSSMLM